jgi:hypothetical protein
MDRRACVTVKVVFRKVVRHPITIRTIRSGSLLRRHVVRSATLGLFPSTVNDLVFHHAPLNIDEFLHITQDTVTVSVLNALVAVVSTAAKF